MSWNLKQIGRTKAVLEVAVTRATLAAVLPASVGTALHAALAVVTAENVPLELQTSGHLSPEGLGTVTIMITTLPIGTLLE